MSEPEQPTAVAEPTSSTADRVTPETSDQRLLRGARARREIARHAVEVASAEGLNGLSIGRLAGDLGLSKSGIATLFGSKEKVQLAAVASAGEAFVDAVVRPASSAPHGAARVRALTEYWIAYAEAPLFAGGCFWGANLAEFDSHPGPVRDALLRQHGDWLALLARELRYAADTGELAGSDADLVAFQLDAVLKAANIALRCGDDRAGDRIRRVLDGFLTPRA